MPTFYNPTTAIVTPIASSGTVQPPKDGGTDYSGWLHWISDFLSKFSKKKFEFHHDGCWLVQPGAWPTATMLDNIRDRIGEAIGATRAQVALAFTPSEIAGIHINVWVPICKRFEGDNIPRDKNGAQAQGYRSAANGVFVDLVRSGKISLYDYGLDPGAGLPIPGGGSGLPSGSPPSPNPSRPPNPPGNPGGGITTAGMGTAAIVVGVLILGAVLSRGKAVA